MAVSNDALTTLALRLQACRTRVEAQKIGVELKRLVDADV